MIKRKIGDFVSSNIERGFYPGSQVLIAQHGEVVVDLALGSMVRGSGSSSDRVREDTLFNLESITKVMVTLPLAFKLIEEGKLHLDDRVVDFIEEFGTNEDKKKVTVRNLLNFTGGIPLDDPEGSEEAALHGNLEEAWRIHYTQNLVSKPGSKVLYSDVSCRILGKLLEKVMGKSLGQAARELIFEPLEMKDTMFNPPDKRRCAATGVSDKGRLLKGECTQDLEHYLGGVLGSDGLFSTAHDMFIFSDMILNKGIYRGQYIFSNATIEKMTGQITNQGIYEEPSSYLQYILHGPKVWLWEYASSRFSFFGDLVSGKAIGKMGGAGTFLMIDPVNNIIIVYLTNYGQPERTLEGDTGWNKFLKEINPMGLCNIVLGNLNKD